MTVEVARGREPTQARSRERVARILAAATELIAQRGSEHLKMGELAAKAEVSVGSLYQYFPDKAAVILALAERISEGSRRCIAEALEPVRTQDELGQAFGDLIDLYWRLFQAEPVRRDIWAGAAADKALMAVELAENRASGEVLAAAILRARPHADRAVVATTAFLVWQLGEAAMRLAVSLPRPEGDAVVAAYRRMSVDAVLTAG